MRYDSDFLKKLDKERNRVIYAKVIALTFQETPVESIEGRITGGTINIDGSSAVRRTCSLTIAAQDFNISDYYWGLNTKFELQIGVENHVDSNYPDIIWFKQGIYVITSFSTARSTNSFTISISGKDKMCLLNGEIGGTLESSIDFGTIEEEDKDGNWVIRKYPIDEIIRNAVHTYGGEPYHNIIINDLDTYGLELLEYRYDTPLYLYRAKEDSQYTNATLDGSVKCDESTFDSLSSEYLEPLVTTLTNMDETKPIHINGKEYYLTKIEYGDTAGYRLTDLTYAGDLIANIGDSLTSILDKIKNMLTYFEYFYDVEGRFVFQKKRSLTETLWSPESDKPIESLVDADDSYVFSGTELITTFNNNPNLANVRNDYSIWGERTTASGAQVPVHIRYAIDNKPVSYTTIEVEDDNAELAAYNEKYGLAVSGSADRMTYISEDWDWREVIYQMAKDYYRYNFLSDFELRVAKANSELYPTGRTGYEGYYTDLEGFWRQLYNPEIVQTKEKKEVQLNKLKQEEEQYSLLIFGQPQDNYNNNLGGLENYLISMKNDSDNMQNYADECRTNFKPSVNQDLLKQYTHFYDDSGKEITTASEYFVLLQVAYTKAKQEYLQIESDIESLNDEIDELAQEEQNFYLEEGDRQYWAKAVYEAPHQLNFWFDFLDTSSGSELDQFNVKNIGFRAKAINDTNVKGIYFRETPDIIFVNKQANTEQISSYRYIQSGAIESMFSISAQGKSAKDRLDELLYEFGYSSESVSISAVPIYHLEPNTRIYIYDKDVGIDGHYVVSKITLPLTYNGTMSITATKAAETWKG